jgi:hypothetical protein
VANDRGEIAGVVTADSGHYPRAAGVIWAPG